LATGSFPKYAGALKMLGEDVEFDCSMAQWVGETNHLPSLVSVQRRDVVAFDKLCNHPSNEMRPRE